MAEQIEGCSCRWIGSTVITRCDLHKAWFEVIAEWAERAKAAEVKLAAMEAKPLTPATRDVLAERQRQVQAEGYDREHDAEHGAASLAAAAGCYALFADAFPNAGEPPPQWPWEVAAWKPKTFRRDMVRASALLLAAIETSDWAEADRG